MPVSSLSNENSPGKTSCCCKKMTLANVWSMQYLVHQRQSTRNFHFHSSVLHTQDYSWIMSTLAQHRSPALLLLLCKANQSLTDRSSDCFIGVDTKSWIESLIKNMLNKSWRLTSQMVTWPHPKQCHKTHTPGVIQWWHRIASEGQANTITKCLQQELPCI